MKAGRALTADEFVFVAAVCTFFYLFGVMADRDRLPAARTFVKEIGAPEALGDVARELEYAYPTRRTSPRPKSTLLEYLARADERLAGLLDVDNHPGLSPVRRRRSWSVSGPSTTRTSFRSSPA